MAGNRNIDSLQKEFPDLSQSMLGDVLSTCQNDKKQATKALRQINEDIKREHDGKIREAQESFPNLPREIIEATLREAQWNIENALVPLLEKVEEYEKQRKIAQQEAVRRQQEIEKENKTKKKLEELHQVFKNIPMEVVQQTLDENDGDMEETANQLFEIVAKYEEKKEDKKAKELARRQEEERKLRELQIQTLSDRFELSEQEVVPIMEKTQWNIKMAVNELSRVSLEKKRKAIRTQFPALTTQEIDAALDINKGNVANALKQLHSQKTESEKKVVKVVKVAPTSLEDLEQQIENEITASQMVVKREMEAVRKASDEAAKAQFKSQLENIIATQARKECGPGIAPPLPRQIDAMLKKERPIVEVEESPKLAVATESQVEDTKIPDDSPVSLVLSTKVVDIGQPIAVEWEVRSGDTTSYDWIGMYPLKSPTLNKHYLTYQYKGKGDKKGSVTFYAPQYYGEYEFRYFLNGSYESVARSEKLKVGPQIQLEATRQQQKIAVKWSKTSGNEYSRAWIGLYLKSEANNKQYITWEYANKPNTEVLFDSPIKPDEYEFRFFTNSYEDVARSNTIHIEGKDTLVVTVADGMVNVKVNIVTVDPYQASAWVGLYFKEEKDHRQWRRYRYFKEHKTEIQFKAPATVGIYEARLFANGTYEPLLRSEPFQLEGRKWSVFPVVQL